MLYNPFTKPIEEFLGQYRFLSNFYPVQIVMDDEVCPGIYPSVEHAYQAAKTLNEFERNRIKMCSTAGNAKRAGRQVTLRSDWEQIKLKVMLCLLEQKFKSQVDLQKKLLATGDAQLIEGNHWGDTFWGVCGGTGQNHLGKLLMQVRKEIRDSGR